jgi:hypothetical protein
MSYPGEVSRHDDPLQHAPPSLTKQSETILIGDPAGEEFQMSAPPFRGIGGTAGEEFRRPPPALGGDAARVLFGYKFMWLSIALSMIFGPLGLFYVSFLNGLVALGVVSTVIPALALPLAGSMGGGLDLAGMIGIPIAWCVTVPWAIIATKRHNAKL